MNIIITAPNLNPSKNVSGVSTVVQTIIQYNKQHTYYHYLLGRPDKKISRFRLLFQLLKQLVLFPFILKKNKIDLVHQNLPFNPKGVLREFVINVWCRMFHMPVLLHVHGGVFLMNGTPNKFYNLLSKSLLKHCSFVVVLSELEKEALSIIYQYSSAIVLQNSIDTSLYHKLTEKTLNDKPTFIFLGRIHESKGIEEIIEAFKYLKKDIDFKFILCGDGPLKEMFVTECKIILEKDFEYLGIVSGIDKLNAIYKSDYFLLPSRYGEGLPMALLETMAAGLVPIVTDDASMKFVVQNKFNGIQVDKRDSQDLYEKLKLILSDAALYKSISENAKKTIIEHYDIKNYIVQLNKIYKKIIVK